MVNLFYLSIFPAISAMRLKTCRFLTNVLKETSLSEFEPQRRPLESKSYDSFFIVAMKKLLKNYLSLVSLLPPTHRPGKGNI